MLSHALLVAHIAVLGYWLGAFAGVIASGTGIRRAIVRYYAVWHEIRDLGSSPEREARLRARYAGATAVLVGLWLFIALIVALSVLKP